MRTPEEALKREYIPKDMTCALCGAPGDILYHDLGGWWCYEHQHIPEKEFLKNQEPLDQGIKRFIDYHS